MWALLSRIFGSVFIGMCLSGFVIILMTLFFMPNGLFGRRGIERV